MEVVARSDFPAKEEVIKTSETTTVESLLELAGKTLEVPLSSYSFYAVNFMEDVLVLDSKVYANTLKAQGIKDKAVLFFRAGAELKPPPRKLTPDKEEDEDPMDKYKGITFKNLFTLLRSKKKKKRTLAGEYLDIYMSEVADSKQWKNLEEKQVAAVLRRNTLNIPEVDLFQAVLTWVKAQEKKTTKDRSELLKPLLPLIRFPIMSTEDVALKVAPEAVLPQEQLVTLFTYLGSDKPSPALPAALKMFSRKPRDPRKPPPLFQWSMTMKHPSLLLSEENMVVRSTNSTQKTVMGDKELKEGTYVWEIEITQLQSTSHSLYIGVVPLTESRWSSSFSIGTSGSNSGWSYCVRTSRRHNGSSLSYGKACSAGEVVKVRLTVPPAGQSNGRLEFLVNGVSQGIAYRNIRGPVRPALSLYGNTQVKLRFP